MLNLSEKLQAIITSQLSNLLRDHAYQLSLAKFLEEYTLHDSQWLGLWSESNGESYAIIELDVVFFRQWAKSIQHRILEDRQTIYLCLHFSKLYVAISRPLPEIYEVIGTIESIMLTQEEQLQWLSFLTNLSLHSDFADFTTKPNLVRTFIMGIKDWHLLIHDEMVEMVCFDEYGEWVKLPGLEQHP